MYINIYPRTCDIRTLSACLNVLRGPFGTATTLKSRSHEFHFIGVAFFATDLDWVIENL